MKEIKVVIGANFGDEGKGRMTDYFCKNLGKDNTVVIRFNSGAQAGHTVTMEDGTRHIFSHYGCGTLRGVPTCLSRFFIINPALFLKKREELAELMLGEEPVVMVSRKCLVTTPYDMLLNQIIEKSRGENRHGSCGVGFYETIVRSSKEQYVITAKDLEGLKTAPVETRKCLKDKLNRIRQSYIPERLKEQKITELDSFYEAVLSSEKLLNDTLHEMEKMAGLISFLEIGEVLSKYDHIVFEGAQGLMLDQSFRYFPHVTPSNTGMKNVVTLLEESKQKVPKMEIAYVSRCYMTRHGAGPFPNELNEKPYENIVDLTNHPNEYQGTMRFAYFNVDETTQAIKDDLENVPPKYSKTVAMAITCLDQVEDRIYVQENELVKQVPRNDMRQYIQKHVYIDNYYECNGPAADDTK